MIIFKLIQKFYIPPEITSSVAVCASKIQKKKTFLQKKKNNVN